MASASGEKTTEEQLMEVGNNLLKSPPLNETLILLNRAEDLLADIDQAPKVSLQNALYPLMKALISDALFKHSDVDVRVSVASCFNEITRITAPQAPYGDERMKEIFKLIVESFEKLSEPSTSCYKKAVSVLFTVARVRSCIIMLDLECDWLIHEMFQCFLKVIRSNHPPAVFTAMENIMTMVIDESDAPSLELVGPLLASTRKENEDVAPVALKLAEKVLCNCAPKLQPFLKGAVESMGTTLDAYSATVASLCQNAKDDLGCDHVASSPEQMHRPNDCIQKLKQLLAEDEKVAEEPTDTPEIKACNGTANTGGVAHDVESRDLNKKKADLKLLPKKRGWKPNSLRNPEEGYDHYWISGGKKTAKNTHLTKPFKAGVKSALPNAIIRKEASPPTNGKVSESKVVESRSMPSKLHAPKSTLGSNQRISRPKKGEANDQDADHHSLSSRDAFNLHLARARSGKKSKDSSSLKAKNSSGRSTTAGRLNEEEDFASSSAVSDSEIDISDTSLGGRMEPAVGAGNASAISRADASAKKISLKKQWRYSKPDEVLSDAPKDKVSKPVKLAEKDENNVPNKDDGRILRKRTKKKEEESEAQGPGEELLGKRIKVWWPQDKMFYEGVIQSYYPAKKKKHLVLYDDGIKEQLNLERQKWGLVEDSSRPDEAGIKMQDPKRIKDVTMLDGDREEAGHPKPDASSNDLQKEKRKKKAKAAQKSETKLFFKRMGASLTLSKVQTSDSSFKAADGPISENPVVLNTLDDVSRISDGLDDTKKPHGEAEVENTEETNPGSAASAHKRPVDSLDSDGTAETES